MSKPSVDLAGKFQQRLRHNHAERLLSYIRDRLIGTIIFPTDVLYEPELSFADGSITFKEMPKTGLIVSRKSVAEVANPADIAGWSSNFATKFIAIKLRQEFEKINHYILSDIIVPLNHALLGGAFEERQKRYAEARHLVANVTDQLNALVEKCATIYPDESRAVIDKHCNVTVPVLSAIEDYFSVVEMTAGKSETATPPREGINNFAKFISKISRILTRDEFSYNPRFTVRMPDSLPPPSAEATTLASQVYQRLDASLPGRRGSLQTCSALSFVSKKNPLALMVEKTFRGGDGETDTARDMMELQILAANQTAAFNADMATVLLHEMVHIAELYPIGHPDYKRLSNIFIAEAVQEIVRVMDGEVRVSKIGAQIPRLMQSSAFAISRRDVFSLPAESELLIPRRPIYQFNKFNWLDETLAYALEAKQPSYPGIFDLQSVRIASSMMMDGCRRVPEVEGILPSEFFNKSVAADSFFLSPEEIAKQSAELFARYEAGVVLNSSRGNFTFTVSDRECMVRNGSDSPLFCMAFYQRMMEGSDVAHNLEDALRDKVVPARDVVASSVRGLASSLPKTVYDSSSRRVLREFIRSKETKDDDARKLSALEKAGLYLVSRGPSMLAQAAAGYAFGSDEIMLDIVRNEMMQSVFAIAESYSDKNNVAKFCFFIASAFAAISSIMAQDDRASETDNFTKIFCGLSMLALPMIINELSKTKVDQVLEKVLHPAFEAFENLYEYSTATRPSAAVRNQRASHFSGDELVYEVSSMPSSSPSADKVAELTRHTHEKSS